MEENIWDLVLPYFKGYSVQCIDWRNVKEQSEFAGTNYRCSKDENVILVGWSLGALAAIQAYKKLRQKASYLLVVLPNLQMQVTIVMVGMLCM